MAKLDPEILTHLEWIGFVKPTGLVVSAPAMVRAGAILDRRDIEGQRLLRGCVEDRVFDLRKDAAPHLPSFRAFAESVLGWSFSPKGYAGMAETPIPPELEVLVYGETLRPDFAVRELEPREGALAWQLVVCVLAPGEDFERVVRGDGEMETSAHGRMERLLRQTGAPAALLFNGRVLRLLSAPRGESSGWIDFRVADMVQTAGRPICTALRLLLGQPRLLSLPRSQRLAALLEDSRKFQSEVSDRLSEQVLHALYEFLRGFQAANDASKGELLRQPLAERPDEVYRALLTVILRLVFLLYAEERDMLPEKDEAFLRYYSLAGLYERLREDAALFPDTMDQRFGAWPQLLVLFRMIHDGAESGEMRLPSRHGVLFDPDRFPFLEGRPSAGARQIHERIEPPFVPDGTIYRALEKLLILDGERISYRALDVQQIGSVYEAMMGFRLETTAGASVAIKAQKKQGAPTAVDLEALLREPSGKREKWLLDRADRKLADAVKEATAAAATLEDLHAALLPAIDAEATPDLVPKGAMVLQPSEERRRSGSHYTPRTLTEPIVRMTLEPILARLRGADGRSARPEQILDLKVCDPAMGSGAFLVEACRQLGEALVEAWHAHGELPQLPRDEREDIFAMRLIAQRCLYGVDRNPVAVDLAKVSLWLVTLAKDHALTFVDHALRHGDSLVGLSRRQIEAFHWEGDAPTFQAGFEAMRVREHVAKVAALRRWIREAEESVSDAELRDRWDEAQSELCQVRLFGDLVLAAFFQGDTPKERETKRSEYANAVVRGDTDRYRGWLEDCRHVEHPLAPLHWEIEFPEVFDRENGGFDAMVGNPPFLGGTRLEPVLGTSWRAYCVRYVVGGETGVRGSGDLVAYFLSQCHRLTRNNGTLGFVTTNSISQGDTRRIGLSRLVRLGASIYAANSSATWPGMASIEYAQVWLIKGRFIGPRSLNGEKTDNITPFLGDSVEEEEPLRLMAAIDKSFEGVKTQGSGFLISEGEAKKLRNAEDPSGLVVRPYLAGQDLTSRRDCSPSRWAINFWDWPLSRGAEDKAIAHCASDFPMCLSIVATNVRPERLAKPPTSSWNRTLRDRWWQYPLCRPALYQAIADMDHVFARAATSSTHALARVSTQTIFSNGVIVFAFDDWPAFCVLQASPHEVWIRKYASSLRNDLRYTPTSCFQTFPFPENWKTDPRLEAAGVAYYEFRAALMIRNDEGLTSTYNRFHDPDERNPEIVKLRDLHAAMDRAVLDAYGWIDIPTECEFLLDHQSDEEESGNRRKPCRYRWPDEIRDEVLARLLELNAKRAKEEAHSGAAATKGRTKKGAAKGAPEESDTRDLFS